MVIVNIFYWIFNFIYKISLKLTRKNKFKTHKKNYTKNIYICMRRYLNNSFLTYCIIWQYDFLYMTPSHL